MTSLSNFPHLTRLGRERAVFVIRVLAVAAVLASATAFALGRLIPRTVEAEGPLRAAVLAAANAAESPDTVRVPTATSSLAAICRPSRAALVMRRTTKGWSVDHTTPAGPARALVADCRTRK
jgi:hypothetical protein